MGTTTPDRADKAEICGKCGSLEVIHTLARAYTIASIRICLRLLRIPWPCASEPFANYGRVCDGFGVVLMLSIFRRIKFFPKYFCVSLEARKPYPSRSGEQLSERGTQ